MFNYLMNIKILFFNFFYNFWYNKVIIVRATDYYKAYINNGYYYYVNYLYPFAMLKSMPHKIIKFYKML